LLQEHQHHQRNQVITPVNPLNLQTSTLKEEFFAKKLNWVSISSLQKRNPIGLISVLCKIETQLGWCQFFAKEKPNWVGVSRSQRNSMKPNWVGVSCSQRNSMKPN
jgi:hypothetical protein